MDRLQIFAVHHSPQQACAFHFAHPVTIFRGDLPEMWMAEMRKVNG
jgi:hypothetical protein